MTINQDDFEDARGLRKLAIEDGSYRFTVAEYDRFDGYFVQVIIEDLSSDDEMYFCVPKEYADRVIRAFQAAAAR